MCRFFPMSKNATFYHFCIYLYKITFVLYIYTKNSKKFLNSDYNFVNYSFWFKFMKEKKFRWFKKKIISYFYYVFLWLDVNFNNIAQPVHIIKLGNKNIFLPFLHQYTMINSLEMHGNQLILDHLWKKDYMLVCHL